MDRFDIAVIGAGHAGCEAALACARMGLRTLLLTLNLDAVALMPCNPSIGGTGKGHLVREVDALGGEMGRAIDDTFIQSRMLNTGKGPAVHSLRAQADKRAYQQRMLSALFSEPNLEIRQGECGRILCEVGCVTGFCTTTGARIACRALIVCAGVYMDSRIIIGECAWQGGLLPAIWQMRCANWGFPCAVLKPARRRAWRNPRSILTKWSRRKGIIRSRRFLF